MIDFVPHDYQQYCIDWIVQNPYCGVCRFQKINLVILF